MKKGNFKKISATWVATFALLSALPPSARATTPPTTTLYFNQYYEKEIATGKGEAEEVTETKHYYAGSQIAQRKKEAGEEEEELIFLHQDQLASTRLITNARGEKLATLSYYPYGAIHQYNGVSLDTVGVADAPTARQYTSQIYDPSAELYFYNARYYNPHTASFVSADTAEGPNRYAYVEGNPINASDPSGYALDAGGGGRGPVLPEIRKVGPALWSVARSYRYLSSYTGVAGRKVNYVSRAQDPQGVKFPPYYYSRENPTQVVRAYPPEDHLLREQLATVLVPVYPTRGIKTDPQTGMMAPPVADYPGAYTKYFEALSYNLKAMFKHAGRNATPGKVFGTAIPNLGTIMESGPVCFEYATFTHLALAELGIESFLTGVAAKHADLEFSINGEDFIFSSGVFYRRQDYPRASSNFRMSPVQLVTPENPIN